MPFAHRALARAAIAKRTRDQLDLVALAALLAMVVSIPAWLGYSGWSRMRAEKADWTIAGPACPVVDRPSARVVGRKPAKTFTYGDITFTRQFGHASCNGWRADGPGDVERVCQFSGPGAVAVTAGAGTVIFEPGVGRRATVSVRRGRPSCVVAGWFTT